MEDAPSTERVNPSTADIDRLDTKAILHRINDEDRRAAPAVEREIDEIAAAVDAIVDRLRDGGRLHYFGAGSSGRLAMADAAEMPPTFGVPESLVQGHIAGGPAALTRSVEDAEDDRTAGEDEVRRAGIGKHDAVIGISASGAAPYVVGAVHEARAAGALTVAIVNVERSPLHDTADVTIALRTGPEAIAGSTRMKAAAAQ